MSDIEFVEGLIVKAPNPKAPDFVKADISIQPAKLAEWLKAHADEEWVNVDVKESRGGKWYAAVNAYKRDAEPQERRPRQPRGQGTPAQVENGGVEDSEIPF